MSAKWDDYPALAGRVMTPTLAALVADVAAGRIKADHARDRLAALGCALDRDALDDAVSATRALRDLADGACPYQLLDVTPRIGPGDIRDEATEHFTGLLDEALTRMGRRAA